MKEKLDWNYWNDCCIVVIKDTYDSLSSPMVSLIFGALAIVLWLRESSIGYLYDGAVNVDVVSPNLTPCTSSKLTLINPEPAVLLNLRLIFRSSGSGIVAEHPLLYSLVIFNAASAVVLPCGL